MILQRVLRALSTGLTRLRGRIITVNPQALITDYISEEDEGVRVEADGVQDLVRGVPRIPTLDYLEESLGRYQVLSIDGSSRLVRTESCNITVASVALYSGRYGLIADYPCYFSSLSYERVMELFRESFISLQPRVRLREYELASLETELRREAGHLVRVKSPAGAWYDCDYNMWQVADEARLMLETRALEIALEHINSFAIYGSGTLVVLDGPLYPTPRIFYYRGDVREDYLNSYGVLIERRVRLLRLADERGINVLGVVKRLADSHKLYRCDEMIALISRLRGQRVRLEKAPDEEVVAEAVRLLRQRGYARFADVIAIGPFRLSLTESDKLRKFVHAEIPDKYAIYLWMPVSPYWGEEGFVLRIEATPGTWSRMGMDSILYLLAYGINRVKGVPRLIEAPDEVSRRVARVYFVHIAWGIAPISPLSYETRVELSQEGEEGVGIPTWIS